MKIKTIITNTDKVEYFDASVNELLSEGWTLTKREVLPGMNYNENNWARRALYAELVLYDEPSQDDYFDALRSIKDACACVPQSECSAGRCPLYSWCKGLSAANDPTDWVLPGEEARE